MCPDINSTLSIFDLAVDFIGFGRPAAGRPNPMKSTAKSKMDKVEIKRRNYISTNRIVRLDAVDQGFVHHFDSQVIPDEPSYLPRRSTERAIKTGLPLNLASRLRGSSQPISRSTFLGAIRWMTPVTRALLFFH